MTSPTVLYRTIKVFRRNKTFDNAAAPTFFFPADGQDCVNPFSESIPPLTLSHNGVSSSQVNDQDQDNYDDTSTISSMATGDNIGAGRTVYNYAYKPAGLWVEKKLNRVLGPYLASPYVIGQQLIKPFGRLSISGMYRAEHKLTYLEQHLRKQEFVAFRRLISDAR